MTTTDQALALASEQRCPICGRAPVGTPENVVKMAELCVAIARGSDDDHRSWFVYRFVDAAGHKWEASR